MRKLQIIFGIFVLVFAVSFIYFTHPKASELTPEKKEKAVAQLLRV